MSRMDKLAQDLRSGKINLLKEVAEPDTTKAKKALKSLKKMFGAGAEEFVMSNHASISWSKRGGHAGMKQLDRIREKAEKMGFKETKAKETGTPDGSHIGSGATYTDKHGNKLSISHSYGRTASSNWYSASLELSKSYIDSF